MKKDEKTAKVIGCINSCSNIVIPHSIEYESTKYIVKSISQSSFKDSESIKMILFANSTIETLLFTSNVSQLDDGWCYNTPALSKTTIVPNNEYFLSIDNKMILGNSNLYSDGYDILVFVSRDAKTITIPSFIKQISSYAFQHSHIESIFIPRHVIKICEGAFDHCEKFRNVEFEKKLRTPNN